MPSVVALEVFGNDFWFPASKRTRENVVDLLWEVFAIQGHGCKKREKRREEGMREMACKVDFFVIDFMMRCRLVDIV